VAVVSSRAGLREGTGSRRPLRCLSKEQRRRHAQEVGDLKAAAVVYANQVQVLGLRNAELEADNRRLVAQLAQVEAAVIPMANRT
jgi:hypothetical protein